MYKIGELLGSFLSIFKHPKQLILFVVLAIVCYSGYKIISANNTTAAPAKVEIQPYPEHYPKGEFAVQTASRLYFTDNFTDNVSAVTLTGYWEYTKDKWVYHKTAFSMARKYFGDIKIYANG